MSHTYPNAFICKRLLFVAYIYVISLSTCVPDPRIHVSLVTDPDPTCFLLANKMTIDKVFSKFFCLLLTVGIFTSVFKNKFK